jgi:Tfp pilus assembly protein PilX
MSIHERTDTHGRQSGSALVIALIVLVILAALGYMGLEVADLNIFSAANDRDSKAAFFQADAGANVGMAYLQSALDTGNSTYYDGDAHIWQNATTPCPEDSAATPFWDEDLAGNCLECNNADTTMKLYAEPAPQATYVRAGKLGTLELEGSAAQIGAGYEGIGKSIAKGGAATDYLVRARRYGERNSRAEVDSAWREIMY